MSELQVCPTIIILHKIYLYSYICVAARIFLNSRKKDTHIVSPLKPAAGFNKWTPRPVADNDCPFEKHPELSCTLIERKNFKTFQTGPTAGSCEHFSLSFFLSFLKTHFTQLFAFDLFWRLNNFITLRKNRKKCLTFVHFENSNICRLTLSFLMDVREI